MNRSTIRTQVARNINQLASDESTITAGIVTSTAINSWIDQVYREILFPLLSDRYPEDFAIWSYPQALYTATSTVASVSTTTLTIDDAVFTNKMEGLEIENATQEERIEIATYSSTTSVVMESTVADWDVGDTVYVLGKTYTLQGDLTDLKEIIGVETKYDSGDKTWTPHDYRKRSDLYQRGTESFSKSNPYWYPETVMVSDVPLKAVTIEPAPNSYQGKIRLYYVQVPPALTDTTEPVINTAGVSDIIISGATARAFRALGEFEKSTYFEEMDDKYGVIPRGTGALIKNYRPKTRQGSLKVRPSRIHKQMRTRKV